MRWKPRSSFEALVQCDTLLAEITPRYRDAVTKLLELQPGMSGRPAGSGDPGGGSSFSRTSVVERAAKVHTDNQRPDPEVKRLARLVELPRAIEVRILRGANWPSLGLPSLGPNAMVHQQLTWSRAAVRYVTATRAKFSGANALHGLVCELHDLVMVTTTDPSKPKGERTTELAVDITEMWCTCCLRGGHRSPRSDRYADGLCRWCGEFKGKQGEYPSLRVLDAHHAGKSITEAMILAERPRRVKKRRK